MRLPEICIRRPVFTIVLSLIILALGGVFFTKLQIRDTPNINPPIITIHSEYAGADAQYMEKQITKRIEDAIKTVKNLDDMSSSSSVGQSDITLSFDLDTDIEIALNDVRSLISGVSQSLPDDMKMPTAAKMDSDAQPSLWITVNSDRYDNLELTQILDNQIKSVLERLPTVGKSNIYGARYYTMIVEPISVKMFQHLLTPFDLEKALRAQNKDYPAGSIKNDIRVFSLKLSSTLNTPSEFENVILKKYPDGTIVKLKDVAKISLESHENEVTLRYNGKESLAIGLVKQSSANIIELSDSVREELPKILKNLPAGITINIPFDAAVPVKASIKSVYLTILEAIALVGLITYIFLGSIRITLIPLVTIPISLIGTFSAMYMLGFTINTFTLLAMILAIGLVVDDAIVMLENIFRHNQELGKKPIQAAQDASKEISFAIVAMTITLASVFLPVGFIDGFLGKLFIEFAWTLAFCVLFSGFVALTLTPMMTSRMIKTGGIKRIRILELFNQGLIKFQILYIKLLKVALNNKIKFYIICAGLIGVLAYASISVEKTFVPSEDQGFIQVIFSGPEGSSLEESLKTVIQAEKIMEDIEEIEGYFEVVGWGGGDNAFAFVPLKDWSKRSRSQFDIVNELNEKLSKLPGMTIFAINPPSMGGNSGKDISFYLQTSLQYSELDQISQNFVSQMKKNSAFQNVERGFKASTPTLDIIVDREKAYRYGVDIETIGKTVQYLIAGRQVGDFRLGNDIYEVIIRYDAANRSTPSDVKKIYIKSDQKMLLPLETVAKVMETITVKEYKHFNNSRAIKITSDLAPGQNLTEAAAQISELAKKIIDKNNTQLVFRGQIKQMNESGNDTIITFLFALLFIYLVLSSQFESFTDSLLILMAVPFSITGGILALFVFGDTLNMYSNIGLITLIGLITKNSIMLVEFTNQLRIDGKKIHEAVVESTRLRLRPILMTSIATMCGALPLVLASGAGAASRNSIGLVIVGGMLIGTIFTIFVIPVLYKTFKREKSFKDKVSF